MRRALAVLLALLAAPTLGQLAIETLGQAQLVARRRAFDAATRDLHTQVDVLRVSETQNLGQWLHTRPEERREVNALLRRAQVVLDEPIAGSWRLSLCITAGEVDELLTQVRLEEDPSRVLTGRGSAEIPWRGADVNTTPEPRRTENLPPSPDLGRDEPQLPPIPAPE